MTIKAYKPAISITLTRLVTRAGADLSACPALPPETVDLTPYLGDGGSVRVHKSIREPAGGFSISFADRMDAKSKDTVYALVEPMDMIEIRASREPHKFSGKPLPLLMRGFVSSVRRVESIGEDGTPQRAVVIQGQDAGKLWQIHYILFQMLWHSEIPFMTLFQSQAMTGISATYLPVSEFMRQLTNYMNDKVAKLSGCTNHTVQKFTARCTVTEGQVAPNIAATYQGNLWDFAKKFADLHWNELFVEDTEDGPVLVFRPAPFLDLKAKTILPGAEIPDILECDIADVVSLDMERSDSRVGNFFWVPPGASLLDSSGYVSIAELFKGEPLDFEYRNNAPAIYGVRKQEAGTALLSDDLATTPRNSENEKADGNLQTLWHVKRRNQLRDMNRDNSVWEDGSMVVKGSEDWKPGRYLVLTRGDIGSANYVVSVSHHYAPMQRWTTQLQVERGSGFHKRTRTGASPFLAEQRKGPYSK